MNALDLVFGTLFVMFLFLGIIFSAYAVMFLMLKPKKKKTGEKNILIIPASAHTEEVEREVYFTRLSLAITGNEQKTKIVILDLGVMPSEREKIEDFCKKDAQVVFICPDKILEVL